MKPCIKIKNTIINLEKLTYITFYVADDKKAIHFYLGEGSSTSITFKSDEFSKFDYVLDKIERFLSIKDLNSEEISTIDKYNPT